MDIFIRFQKHKADILNLVYIYFIEKYPTVKVCNLQLCF